MKIVVLIASLIVAIGGAVFYLGSSSGQNTPLSMFMSKDTQQLAELTRKFMEDLQYKDFKSAALYSLPEHKDKMNVPALIEKWFAIKPEVLDINGIQILDTELDSSQKRAKVKLQADIKILNTNELRKPNVILYWKKLPDGKWYMDLASSL